MRFSFDVAVLINYMCSGRKMSASSVPLETFPYGHPASLRVGRPGLFLPIGGETKNCPAGQVLLHAPATGACVRAHFWAKTVGRAQIGDFAVGIVDMILETFEERIVLKSRNMEVRRMRSVEGRQ